MAADGTVKISVDLETSEFKKGTAEVEKEISDLDKSVSAKKTWEEYAKESSQSFAEIKKEVKTLSAEFEREGYNQKEALEKAYEKIGIISETEMKEAANNVENASEKMEDSLKQVDAEVNDLKTNFGNLGSIAKQSIDAAFYGGIAALTAFGVASVNLASNLTEVQNVVDTTFGKDAEIINDWSKAAVSAYGLSELSAKQYTGTMGAMLKSSGLTGDAIVEMSTGLTGLAGDFASFYNLASDEAFSKIRAGIAGETEPLKQLGINMSVANLEAYALSQGIKSAYSEMSQAEQMTLRYGYLMQAGADATGDFAKTLDTSLANQLRVAQEEIKGISAEIGEELLPYALELIKYLRANTDEIIDFGKSAAIAVVALKGFTTLGTITSAYKTFTSGVSLSTAVMKGFNTVVSANPLGIALVTIAAITVGITALNEEMSKASKETEELNEKTEINNNLLREQAEEIDNVIQKRTEETAGQLAMVANTERLYTELQSIVDINGQVLESDKQRANFILGELNNAMGTEYALIGDTIQGYTDLQSQIYGVIEAKKAEILFAAAEEGYTEAIMKQAEAYALVGEERLKLEQINEQMSEIEQGYLAVEQEMIDKYGESWQTMQGARGDYSRSTKDLNDEMNVLLETQTLQTDSYKLAQEQLDLYLASIENYETAMSEMQSGDMTAAVETLTGFSEAYALATEQANASAEEQLIIAEDNFAAQLLALDDYAAKYEAGVAGYTEAGLEEARRNAAESYVAYQNAGGEIVNGVVAGINTKKINSINAVIAMANEMNTAFRSTLDINSPSGVFKESAFWVPEAVAVSVKDGAKKPIQEVKKMATDMANAFVLPTTTNNSTNTFINTTTNNVNQSFNNQTTSPFEAYRRIAENV